MSVSLDVRSVWVGVDALVDGAASAEGLEHHRLGGIAAHRLRDRGRPVPPRVAAEEQMALMAAAAAPVLLRRLVDTLGPPLVVMKGPAIAARYRSAGERAYRDVDVLVPDAAAAQRRLLASGAELVDQEIAAPDDRHHEAELCVPGIPLVIELHDRPLWPRWARGPRAEELLSIAVEAPDGVSTLPPAEHAVVAAVHSWSHRPLRRVRDLVDVAVLLACADDGDAAAAARRWEVERLWRATTAVIDALFGGRGRPSSLRTWARDLPEVRRRRPAATALEHLAAPFSVLPARPASAAALGELRQAVARRLAGADRVRRDDPLSRAAR